ncbi:hypothetical protein [Actinopolymorpha pittospori]|uniref:Uncharacterized protein n=1 Tax=Actinopolymorpha pittospori TaxID=648752 RepID=A0A927MUD1_9ACTN|nr:hypothetical protein [Actinopolymorpha pittospori]MBE1605423.1 hypothetical protein [Actinopolymorpha pittospori]
MATAVIATMRHVLRCLDVIVGALLVGVLVGLRLPYGSHPVTVSRGTAYFNHQEHLGTFQADHGGASALIPGEVAWTDRAGRDEVGALPSCLRAPEDESVAEARVEAGYMKPRLPNGESTLIVAWIRCL